jgi:hypothetical protein
MKGKQPADHERVILEEGGNPGLFAAVTAQEQTVFSHHVPEDEISGSCCRLEVSGLAKNAATVCHARDHQTVPAGEGLVIRNWLLARVAYLQQGSIQLAYSGVEFLRRHVPFDGQDSGFAVKEQDVRG